MVCQNNLGIMTQELTKLKSSHKLTTNAFTLAIQAPSDMSDI